MTILERIARPRFICLILALITLVIYLPVRRHDFINFDDPAYVQNNPVVQQGLTWEGIKWAFTTGHASNWHPLTWISHMADNQLFGPEPGPQHLVNALIHALNAALFFLLIFRLTGALWPAAFVAGVFAWHPLRVESVAWIAERKDVLGTFFWLLTLSAYVRYAVNGNIESTYAKASVDGHRIRRRSEAMAGQASNTEHRTKQGKIYYGLALLFFALGLMSKPMVVTLPFVMLLLDYWPLGRRAKGEVRSAKLNADGLSTINSQPSTLWRLWLEKIPFFVLAAGASVATCLVQREDALVTLHEYPPGLRLANAVIGYGWYLLKTVWPINLTVYYPVQLSIHWPELIAAALVLAGVSAFVWMTRATKPYLLTGWLWFLGTLIPVVGLVQVGSQAVADRYSYIPSMGLLIAVAAGIQDFLARRHGARDTVVAAGAVILGACVLATSLQLQYWQNSLQLFTRAVKLTTDNALANMNLAAAESKLGHQNEAAARYREALRIAPGDGLAHDSLANVLKVMGHTNDALFEYQQALKYQPDSAAIHSDFGLFLAGTGRYDEAIQNYEAAARLMPGNANPYYLMGMARVRQGQGADAVALFRKVLSLAPGHVLAMVHLARALATDENAPVRNGREAIRLAEKADELTGGDQSFVLDTLAAAYAEAGRFADALQTEQKAIDAAKSAGDTNALPDLQSRLELYQSNKPCRESPADQAAGPRPPG